jgi:hypothetical protein
MKNTEAILDASKEDGLGVNVEELSVCSCPVTRLQDEFIV